MSPRDRFKQRLRELLSSRRKRQIAETGLTPSAVLIPIYENKKEYYILFTKRSNSVESHKGEYTFPGGRRDDDDESLLATAIRESFEEIGLNPQDVEVLGELDDEKTHTTNFVVAPFITLIPYPYEFHINPEEVEEVIGIPISAFQDQNNLQVGQSGETFHYKGYVIWGATARIVNKLVQAVQDIQYNTRWETS